MPLKCADSLEDTEKYVTSSLILQLKGVCFSRTDQAITAVCWLEQFLCPDVGNMEHHPGVSQGTIPAYFRASILDDIMHRCHVLNRHKPSWRTPHSPTMTGGHFTSSHWLYHITYHFFAEQIMTKISNLRGESLESLNVFFMLVDIYKPEISINIQP